MIKKPKWVALAMIASMMIGALGYRAIVSSPLLPLFLPSVSRWVDDERVFDGYEWRKCDPHYFSDIFSRSTRMQMASSLRRRLLSQLPTDREVLILLGYPDGKRIRRGERQFSYYLGHGSLPGRRYSGSIFLLVGFDQSGRVRHVDMDQHSY